MRRYWLCPIKHEEHLHISEMRVACPSSEELTQLRQVVSSVHPRLLPQFKAHLLLSDLSEMDEEGVNTSIHGSEMCGHSELELDLSSGQPILIDGNHYSLSHCAQSFFELVLLPADARAHMNRVMDMSQVASWTQQQRTWLELCHAWLNNNWSIIVLIEEI